MLKKKKKKILINFFRRNFVFTQLLGMCAIPIHMWCVNEYCYCMSMDVGIILVTDAMAAMGLGDGLHQLGTMTVNVEGKTARLPGTNTLAGR